MCIRDRGLPSRSVSASAGVVRFWKVRGGTVAIGMQKLSAGSGYEYLTRQVAALDATGRCHSTLADYYSARGESPGHWYGSCLASVGLAPVDEVTAEQMKLLFGAGLNPVTGERLGQRYSVYANQPTPFETELGRRLSAYQDEHQAPVPQQVRDRLRTELAREWFALEYGRAPSGPRELHGFIVKATSHPRTSVAGFDLTFTPPKSVSALWAVADPRLASAIRAAHDAAVAAAMRSAERRVTFTRQGHDGIRHVEVRGLIAAVFVHRDSRAGDPNLHTHVAIANKVQTLTGEWLTIDAQVLYRAKVSLSETYTPIAGTPDGAGSVVRGDRRTRSATASPTSSRANQRDLPPGKRTNPPNGIVQNTPNLRHRWNRPAAARASAGDQPTRP